MLLDPDTPFLELCIFAGYKESGSSPCASIVAGIGIVKYIPPKPSLTKVASNAWSLPQFQQ